MKKILLVEDEKPIQRALKTILEDANYHVSTANNGKEALEFLKDEALRPDLILLDLMMPEMNGIDFRQLQLDDPDLEKIPVIILTANNNHFPQKEKLKAFEFLNKPIEIKDLLYVVENFFYLAAKSTSAELT